jgi:NADPH:quinone reductase-like Zn-dependent oxidoreductase
MARVVRFHRIGGPEVLRIEEVEVPPPGKGERGKRFINDGLADGSLEPIIARAFPLEQIVQAHRYMESNQQFGKIVVTV